MARPQKTGIDYFSLDVYMDTKIKLVEAKFGIEGFGILIKLYQHIYSEGYFCKWTDDEQLLFAHDNKIDEELMLTFIEFLLTKKIFDEGLYNKYSILTSSGTQKRYIQGTQRRKEVSFIKEYLLVDIDEKTYPKTVNVYINLINDNDNSKKDNINPQSKVKESKDNNNKENAFAFYEQNGFGVLSPHISDLISNWLDDGLDESIILLAMKNAIENNVRKWKYVDKTLLDWHNHGLKTIEQVQAYIEEYQHKKQSRERGQPNKQPIKKEKVPDYILNQDKWDNQSEKTDPEKLAKINKLLKNLGEK